MRVKVLVIDIGGSHVKMIATGKRRRRRFASGINLTPNQLIKQVRARTADWQYDAISLGVPARVDADGIREEPGNLGTGWVRFEFADAFGCPVRVINDAAMQALGAYVGKRMLFLGLGTGLGSAFVAERVIVPLELGELWYRSRESLGERLGRQGLKSFGRSAWQKAIDRTTRILCGALSADYVVLGGGNASEVDPLPPQARRGGNHDAFKGGFRLWNDTVEPHDQAPSTAWRVIG